MCVREIMCVVCESECWRKYERKREKDKEAEREREIKRMRERDINKKRK